MSCTGRSAVASNQRGDAPSVTHAVSWHSFASASTTRGAGHPDEARRVSAPHGFAELLPRAGVSPFTRPVERRLRLSAGRRQQHLGASHRLRVQPLERVSLGWRLQPPRLAAAAYRGWKFIGRRAAQHEAQRRGRLLERLEQCVGRDGVHRFGRMDDDHLHAAARCGSLCESDCRAHRIDLDLPARLALRVCNRTIGLLIIERPAQRLPKGFRQQHQQIRVRTREHQPAAGAAAARPRQVTALHVFAQPRLRQQERQFELADATRPVQEQRVTTRQAAECGQCSVEPRQWQGAVFAYHPRASSAAKMRPRTASCGSAASMRTKRCGAASARAR